MKRLFSLILLLVSGCGFFSPTGSISVENKTAQVIDSLLIITNSHPITFYKVPPFKVVHKVIERRLIKGGHDITLSPTIYSDGKAFKGEYYYDDLAGFSGNYTIHIYNPYYVKWSYSN